MSIKEKTEWSDEEIEQWLDEYFEEQAKGIKRAFTVCELAAMIEDSEKNSPNEAAHRARVKGGAGCYS